MDKDINTPSNVANENTNDEQLTIENVSEQEEITGDTQVVDVKKIKELSQNIETTNKITTEDDTVADEKVLTDNMQNEDLTEASQEDMDEDDTKYEAIDEDTANTTSEIDVDDDDFPEVTPVNDDLNENDEADNKIEEMDGEEQITLAHKPSLSVSFTRLWHNICNVFTPKVRKILYIVLSVIFILFVVGYIYCMSNLPTDKIARNVYIEDINVSGMTYDEALEKINNSSLFDNQIITLMHRGNRFEINGNAIGLVASPEETVQKAFDYGKDGSKYKNGLLLLGLHLARHTVVPVAQIEVEKLDEQLQQFGIQCYGELMQHKIVVQADGLTYIGPGKTGFDNNIEDARNKVINALDNEQFKNIWVPLDNCPPDDLTMEAFDAAVYCDPIDSYFKYEGDEVIVVEESIGRYINKEEAAPLLETVHEGGEPVYIPWYASEPQIYKKDIEPKLFNATLGSFSTYYGGAYNRNANVVRAASLLNGAIVPPGEVLSFNDRVGPRTTANGFHPAPEYQNGESVTGIGGGTCQVSTTLYGAVLYSALDITSRTCHMFAVGYAPLGQDATVAYGSVDFKFKNNSDYPIKVVAHTNGGTITVSIVGTAWEPAKTVKLGHSVSQGTGTSVTSRRYIYSNGELIKTEQLPSSYYQPHEEH